MLVILALALALALVPCNCFLGQDFSHNAVKSRTAQHAARIMLERVIDTDEIVNEIQIELQASPSTASSAKKRVAFIPPLLSHRRIMPILKAIFLPSGYPSTTPPEYSAFQSWNLLQDFCSYLRGIMATRAILEGMGVGRADATAVQATIQWIFRDGASMLGGLLFTSLSSSNFGQNVKQWRLFADTINNVGITLDMIAPLFREQFLAIVCVASVFKALCGVAAGATGVAIAEHWGEQNGNIADVLAKNGAQHTLVSILGLLFTVQFARFATSSARLTWALYSVLTAVHMGANYAAMRVLALRTLNRARYALLLDTLIASPTVQASINPHLDPHMPPHPYSHHHTVEANAPQGQTLRGKVLGGGRDTYVDTNTDPYVDTDTDTDIPAWVAANEHSFSPERIAQQEPILGLILPTALRRAMLQLWLFLRHVAGKRTNPGSGSGSVSDSGSVSRPGSVRDLDCLSAVQLWASPSQLCSLFPHPNLCAAMDAYADCPYFLIHDRPVSGASGKVYVCFGSAAGGKEQALAALEAALVARGCNTLLARGTAARAFPPFWEALQRGGWKVGLPLLRPRAARGYEIETR